MASSTKLPLVEHVKFAMAGAQLEYMSNLRTNANNGRFRVGETYVFEHESDVVTRAAIIAALQHMRDNVSKDMILAARRVKHLRVPKRAAEEIMFGAMVDALLTQIEGGEKP